MKKYEDERINQILNNLELEMQVEKDYSHRDYVSDMKELCYNIDKVVDYIKNNKQGKLYLNSNIWENCYFALSDVLKLYDLKFINSDQITDQEEIVKIFDYNNVKDNSDIESTTFVIEEYILPNYKTPTKKMNKLQLLLEIKEQYVNNLLCYSSNNLMNAPKSDYINEFYNERHKLNLIEKMIEEEKIKNKKIKESEAR